MKPRPKELPSTYDASWFKEWAENHMRACDVDGTSAWVWSSDRSASCDKCGESVGHPLDRVAETPVWNRVQRDGGAHDR